MDEDATMRLALPLLHAGQAQKEETHNEALTLIDCLLHASVVAAGLNIPPAEPAAGQCWIVGDEPAGAWAGQARALACWTPGGWRFAAARPGLSAWHEATGRLLTFANGMWQDGVVAATRVTVGGEQVVGARSPAIAAPAGGGIVDTEARTTLAAVLAALRDHGLIAR